MSEDCGFTRNNAWFRYRAGAILVRDGRMLFVKSIYGGYYYMVGGAVQLGETSEECVERETFEETGVRCKADRLAIVCENLFRGHGGAIDEKDCHVLEFYYLVNAPANATFNPANDEGEELVWVPLSEIADRDIRPAFLRTKLSEVFAGAPLIHVINRENGNGKSE